MPRAPTLPGILTVVPRRHIGDEDARRQETCCDAGGLPLTVMRPAAVLLTIAASLAAPRFTVSLPTMKRSAVTRRISLRRPRLDQPLGHLRMTASCCPRQRRGPRLVIREVRLRPAGEKEVHHVWAIVSCGPSQRRRGVFVIPGRDVRPRVEQHRRTFEQDLVRAAATVAPAA